MAGSLKRKKNIFALVTAIMLAMPFQVYASEPAGSLDEVIQQAETQQVQETVPVQQGTTQSEVQQPATQQSATQQPATANESGIPVTSSEFMDNLGGSMNMIGEEATELTPFRIALQRIGRIIVQALILVITFFLPIRCLIDLVYITIPPLQGILSNGKTGQVIQSGSQQNQANGMGIGGMNSSYGIGGMNHSYGMAGGMNGGMNGGMQQGGVSVGFCLVSQAALNAVATEQAGPGKIAAALKCYLKDSVITLVVATVMLILFGSGILQQLGIVVGDWIVNGIANFMSGI